MEDIDTRRKRAGAFAGGWLEFARRRLLQRAITSSRVEVRLPLHPRYAAESAAPVIACYVFGNAAVCLEIRGDNR
jgi:hypothetical protein